jgi:hypothetical protein
MLSILKREYLFSRLGSIHLASGNCSKRSSPTIYFRYGAGEFQDHSYLASFIDIS